MPLVKKLKIWYNFIDGGGIFMQIEALSLHNFRNYDELDFFPQKGFNLIYGDNAQGKTNLLEAIFLCAFGRSHCTVHDSELILIGTDMARVKVKVSSETAGDHTVCITIGNQNKTVEIDGEKIKRLGDLMGMVKVVMFSPQSLSLITGSPSERRRFFDMGISQLSKTYFFKLQQYNLALKQRNALLKSPNAAGYKDYVKTWDNQLAQAGAYIMNARTRYVDSLRPTIIELHSKLSCGQDEFSIEYVPSVRCDNPKEIQQVILDKLADSFDDDIKRGTTYYGIHKDDIATKTNSLDTRIYSSQGQQRTAALALKLSEIELIKNANGDTPIVLLDDVFSELDENRCTALLDSVSDCQCIFTSAQQYIADLFDVDINMVYCQGGKLS